MRLFFAIDLSAEVKGHLGNVQSDWTKRNKTCHLAWTGLDNLHLTLKFLGEVDDPAAGRLLARLRDLPRGGPFMLQTGGMEYFPPRGPVRILAAQLTGDLGRLAELVEALESLAEIEGFPREGRAFKPHVTIGRSRAGLPGHLRAAPFALKPSASFRVSEVVLYESRLKPTGPEYVKVAGFPV